MARFAGEEMKAVATVIAAAIASVTFDVLFAHQSPGWHRFVCVTLWILLWILAAHVTVWIIDRRRKTK